MPDAEELRSLGVDGVAELLRRHPLLVRAAAPTDLGHLAALLDGPAAPLLAIRLLRTSDLQVLEAVVDLGGTVDRDDVCALMHVGAAEAGPVEACLNRLVEAGLVHPEGGGFVAAETVASLLHDPYALGEPFAVLAQWLRADDLRRILAAWSAPTGGRKAELLERVCDLLRDREAVRAVVRRLSGPAKELLAEVVAGYQVTVPWSLPHRDGPLPPHEETIRYGLLLVQGHLLDAPREVVEALRADDGHPPFTPEAPASAWLAVAPELVERESRASASEAVRLVSLLLESSARRPVKVRKDGVIGPRELRRLAKEATAQEADVAQAVDLALLGSLLSRDADDDSTLVPGGTAQEWLRRAPGERAAALARLWWVSPHAVRTAGGARPLPCADCAPFVVVVRRTMLELLREGSLELAAPAAEAAPGRLGEVVAWRLPVAVNHVAGTDADDRRDYARRDDEPVAAGDDRASSAVRATAEATLIEATWLGLVGAGALTAAGSALLRDDATALDTALSSLGSLQATARLQADLTAVVMGVPDVDLTHTLDLLADRETTGAAASWRFTPHTVRRGFDAGMTQDDVLRRLRDLAVEPLPQALEYLVGDVGRRHGQLRVGEAGCYLVARDTALAAEVAADRALRRLGLKVIEGTVLIGACSRAETLQALRAAGYAPAETADGSTVVDLRGPGAAPPTRLPGTPPGRARGTASATSTAVADPPSLLDQRVTTLAELSGAALTRTESLALAERLIAAPVRGPGAMFHDGFHDEFQDEIDDPFDGLPFPWDEDGA